MLAYDYPLLSLMWTIFVFSMWVIWIAVVIWTFIDNFKRTDHGGWAKALWFVFVVFVPVIGVFCYLVSRPIDPYADIVVVD